MPLTSMPDNNWWLLSYVRCHSCVQILAEGASRMLLRFARVPGYCMDCSKFQMQPGCAAFVDLKQAYDSVQHPLVWASLQCREVHDKMLAAPQPLYAGGTMSMKVYGKSGTNGTAKVGVRQDCP